MDRIVYILKERHLRDSKFCRNHVLFGLAATRAGVTFRL
jgi:hypothetical protein